jgi:N-methylhydantoinase A
MSSNRLSADIGGTFTDLVLLDDAGILHVEKTPSTPGDFKDGVLNGIQQILTAVRVGHNDSDSIALKDIEYFVHGATVVLNALIQRKLPITALITTEGFRDVLEIMRTNNPSMYDMRYVKPPPLIPRRLRFEVTERVLHNGEVLTALDESSVKTAAAKLKNSGARAIAVCLIHAYANPAHERRVREIILEVCPDVVVCLSSEVAGELREFERTSTTVINSATVPIIASYLDQLSGALRQLGLRRDLYVMQSNGGVITSSVARDLPVRTILSGPSGGVVGGSYLANEIGLENVVTLDMGGTSTDIGLVSNSRAVTVDESKVDGWPILAPMIEILAIGAGGGSIGWLDAGGGLRVGPQSAGAAPGPVCYRRGGTEPTVSDACLVLNRLNPRFFLGGQMDLDPDGAHWVIEEKVAAPLKMSKEEAAQGMITVVTANMAKAMRQILVARGLDPRDFTLMAFGGAGGMVVGDLLRVSDVNRALVPNNPGALCAIGMLVTDFRYDASATMVRSLRNADTGEAADLFLKLESEAKGKLVEEGLHALDVSIERYVDVRYVGQEYYLKIPVDRSVVDIDLLEKTFNEEHERVYGYSTSLFPCEFVNLRVTALGKVARPKFPTFPKRSKADGTLEPGERRQVYFDGAFAETSIYRIDTLRPGDSLEGPVVIEDPNSTVVILRGQTATVDKYKNILIEELET